jgi:PAT family beta-lactamase induction signal transducer AmpG
VSLAERRWLRLFTLCVLYVAQGIPWGFMAITLPAYLAERGLDVATIGTAIAATYVPYSFKWVWGPLMDAFTIRRFGRRRPWILFAQLAMVVTVGVLLFLPDPAADLDVFLTVVLIHTVFNSMQDVAVDALATDLLDDEERGRANGLMYASKYVGAMIGGAGLSLVIAQVSMRAALATQTALLLAIMLVPLLVRERDTDPAPRPPVWTVMRSLLRAFTIRSAIACAIFVLVANLATGMLMSVSNVLFTQGLGWDGTFLAFLTGGPGLLIGAAGAAAGGLLADKVGHRRLISLALATLAVLWAVFAACEPYWHVRALSYGMLVAQALAVGVLSATVIAMCMDLSAPAVAASQFTVYMALTNLSTTTGSKNVAKYATEHFTYPGIYLFAASLHIIAMLALWPIDPKQVRRKAAQMAG